MVLHCERELDGYRAADTESSHVEKGGCTGWHDSIVPGYHPTQVRWDRSRKNQENFCVTLRVTKLESKTQKNDILGAITRI